MRIAEGRLFAMYAYDVGYEIDLGRLRAQEPAGESPRPGASRSGAPPRLEYTTPPVVLPLGVRPLTVAGTRTDGRVSLRAHDFGAVTVLLEVPLPPLALAELPRLTAALTTYATLEPTARTILDEAQPQLAPAIVRADLAGRSLVEDYYVLQVSRFDPPSSPGALLGEHRRLVAQTLHCEPEALSATEADEVLRTAVTYTDDDLVVTDWNVGLLYDEEYDDALNVLELLNAQLLELRYLDFMLDRRVNRLYDDIARLPRAFAFRHEAARVRELALLRLDAVTLRDRTGNALKLFGDLYLSKLHARTAERLRIGQWQQSVDRRIELVQGISELFATRAATIRAELLELTIIVLIALEIVLYFF